MIIHTSPHELIDIAIGVDARMKKDMLECKGAIESHTGLKECSSCSWDTLKIAGVSVCTMQKVRDAIKDKYAGGETDAERKTDQ